MAEVGPHVSEGTVLYGLRLSVSRDSSGRAVNIVVMANATSVPQTRVLIADDQHLVRTGLKVILDSERPDAPLPGLLLCKIGVDVDVDAAAAKLGDHAAALETAAATERKCR